MKLCPKQHENVDESKFCEICGTLITDLPGSALPAAAPAVLELDSMTDNDDVVSDVDIVHTDDSSIATSLVSSTDDDDDADSDAANDDDDDDDADDVDSADADDDDAADDADDALQALAPAPATTYVSTTSSAIAEMNSWAKNWEVADDPFIKGLNEAVQQNNDLGMWSSLDPTQLLPEMPDQTTIFHRIGNALAILRNIFVFLPVAITWQAIAEATDAYTKWFPATDPNLENTEKNFLDFWANGYGVLPNRYTLPHIGFLDFWIIIGIVLGSLLSTILVSRGDKVNDELRQVFETERLTIAIRIRRALHGKREASPESIATSLADALSDLNQTTRDMAEVAARLEASTTGVMALTPQIEKLNDHAGTFAMQTSTAIAQAVQQLVASVDSLNGSVSTNITSAFQAAVSSLQEVGEEMKRHSTSVEYGTKLLKDDIEEIRKGLRR